MSIQVGTNHADSLTGSGSLDLLFGRGGADTLTGGDGISGLFGGRGADTLHDGATGYSFMFGGRGDDVVVSTHADVMDGGCGTDTAVLLRSASTQSFNIDLSKCVNVLVDGTIMTGFERLVFDGGSGNDVVKGGCLDDYLAGGAGHDALYGGGGNDLILGNATDSLFGGSGDDTISITALPAVVDGGCGTDTLRIVGPMAFTPGVVTNVEKFVVVDGFLNFDHVTGAGDLVSFNNYFDASGQPTTTGPGLVITVAETTLPGEPTQAQAPGVNILGSSHDDSITGGSGEDFLNGGRGNDTLDGGDGVDYALFSGKLGDYGIVHNADGSYTVTDLRAGSPDGTDTLRNIEYIVYDHTSDSVFGHAYLLT